MSHSWDIVSGIFTVIFLLAAFYFLILASVREYGKRGWLITAAIAFLLPAFLTDLIHDLYEIEKAALISHGAVSIAGILFLLSFYLSKKELEKERGQAQ
jgi:hypothetical protein